MCWWWEGGEKGPKTSALKHTHLIGYSKILQSVILFSIFFLHKQSNTFQLDRHIYHFQQFLFVCVSGGAAVRKSVHTCTRVIHRPEHLCVWAKLRERAQEVRASLQHQRLKQVLKAKTSGMCFLFGPGFSSLSCSQTLTHTWPVADAGADSPRHAKKTRSTHQSKQQQQQRQQTL